ncbi:class I SAM-dependent methyltransferase [bacterium]|nr:class I SAM-dependent methyltransferase [bacterium]
MNLNSIPNINLDLIAQKGRVDKSDIVGDFGCGQGYLTKILCKRVTDSGMVYSVDIIRDVLSSLETILHIEGINNFKTIWSNMEIYNATKIDSKSLDAGFLVNILSQSSKEFEVIREAARMVKIGGKIVIADWTKTAISPIAPIDEDRVDIQKIRKLCEKIPEVVEEEIFVAGENYWGIVLNVVN